MKHEDTLRLQALIGQRTSIRQTMAAVQQAIDLNKDVLQAGQVYYDELTTEINTLLGSAGKEATARPGKTGSA